MKLLFKNRLLLECSIPARCQENCCAEEDSEAPGDLPILRGNCFEELTVVQPRVQWSTSLRPDQIPADDAVSKSALELGSQSSVPKAFSTPWADLVKNLRPDTLLTRATEDSLEPRSEDGKSTRGDVTAGEERAEREAELDKHHDPIILLKILEGRHKQALDELEQQVAREREARFRQGQAEARFWQDQAVQQQIQSKTHLEEAARFRQDQAAQQEIHSRTHLEDAAGKGQQEAKAASMVQEGCDAEAKLAAGEEAIEIRASHHNEAAEGKEMFQFEATRLEPFGSESNHLEKIGTQSDQIRSLVLNHHYDLLSRTNLAQEYPTVGPDQVDTASEEAARHIEDDEC